MKIKGSTSGGSGRYFSIAAGFIRFPAHEGEEGAKKREVTNPQTNEKIVKWEHSFGSITGELKKVHRQLQSRTRG